MEAVLQKCSVSPALQSSFSTIGVQWSDFVDSENDSLAHSRVLVMTFHWDFGTPNTMACSILAVNTNK